MKPMGISWLGRLALAAALIVSSLSLAGDPDSMQKLANHFHHDGDAVDHHHGDADDRHESPDGPCHHTPVQCSCSHAPLMETVEASQDVAPINCELAGVVDLSPLDDPTSKDIPHVPRA